jgi:3-deoxy-manno-octulosonate cytidylyltransferase (CMP-KDO synthetase)
LNQDSLTAFVEEQLGAFGRLAAGGTVCAVIPARFASVRFPGKMMADILGISMIQRTFERVRASPAVAQVFITTESEELAAHVRLFTDNVIMSSERPKNGM